MKKILVEFENCYGIKHLKHEFDTSNGTAFLIYAPNGAMKTSFAKVFTDISHDTKPSDKIFPHRITKYLITDEEANLLLPDQIFVVEPYQENFNATRTATLLVNDSLRLEYENAVKTIEEKANQVIEKLAELSQIKKTSIQSEITSTFGFKENAIWDLFEYLSNTISSQENNPNLEKISYGEIFNEKVLSFLSSEKNRQQLEEYVHRYDELISKSTYFRKGLFDHNNATDICKSLNNNGFFKANHTVMQPIGHLRR